MRYPAAFQQSGFQCIHDELFAYLLLFISPDDLQTLSLVNSVFYIFAREEPMWMLHCLTQHGGNFLYQNSWRWTTMRPRHRCTKSLSPSRVNFPSFESPFLTNRWHRCHMTLQNLNLDWIQPARDALAVVDIDSLQDPVAFYQNYGEVPFILQNATKTWKATNDWTPEKLTKRFDGESTKIPAARLRVSHNLDLPSTSSSDMQMTFADYFTYANQQKDETPLYIFDSDFGEKLPALLDDYQVETLGVFEQDYLSLAAKVDAEKRERAKMRNKPLSPPKRPDFRWLVIGPERSGASWHTDPGQTSAWNALIKGRKRWAIYPPDHPPPGSSCSPSSRFNRKRTSTASDHALNMTSLAWYLHVYPTLKPHEKPYEVIQEPGETIYVPNGWWHLVLNLELTIAVTQNFVDSHNLMAFLQDTEASGTLNTKNKGHLLHKFRSLCSKVRPEADEVFRLLDMPRMYGFTSSEAQTNSFSSVSHWKRAIRSVFKRHFTYSDAKEDWWRVSQRQIRSLTSRMNPTFAIKERILIKFFSHHNQEWSEIDIKTYLSQKPRAKETRNDTSDHNLLQLHPVKNTMSLRAALEEPFKIEVATYHAMRQNPSLLSMIARFYDSGHLMSFEDVDESDVEWEDDDTHHNTKRRKRSRRVLHGSYWRWPYIVLEFQKDLIGLERVVKSGGMTSESWKYAANWISNVFLPALHATPIKAYGRGVYGHSKSTWAWYIHYLLRQRRRSFAFHMKENVLPTHLLKQLEQFLPRATSEAIVRDLLPPNASDNTHAGYLDPVLLHGDLTSENILGRLKTSQPLAAQFQLDKLHEKASGGTSAEISGSHKDSDMWEISSASSSDSSDTDDLDNAEVKPNRSSEYSVAHMWYPKVVIDFADAKTGDPLYDLIAVFFAALHGDRNLWKSSMSTIYWQKYCAYSKETDAERSIRFLRLILLHPSRSARALFHFHPEMERFDTWEAIAAHLFSDIWSQRKA